MKVIGQGIAYAALVIGTICLELFAPGGAPAALWWAVGIWTFLWIM
jgi:hypothetical protein